MKYFTNFEEMYKSIRGGFEEIEHPVVEEKKPTKKTTKKTTKETVEEK